MRRIAAAVALLFLLAPLAGCGMPSTAEELAERSLVTSFESVNAFLRAEHANRDLVAREMPDVHRFAEDARREYPPAHRLALAAVELYRSEGTADAKADMSAKRLELERFAAKARAYLASINDRKPRVESLPGSVVPGADPRAEPNPEPERRTHADGR